MLRPLVALSVLVAMPAAAQNPTPTSTGTAKKQDPNKIICEKVETIGSRIAAKRVCMTAAKWEEQKRTDREAVQRLQQNTTYAPSN